MNQLTPHNSMAKRMLWVSMLVLVIGASQVFAAEDITGEWEITMDFGGRPSFATLSISKNADGSLAGKWGSSELSEVKLDGQKLTFVRTLKFGDNEFKMNYEGTLQDGKLVGKVTSDRGEFNATASRKKPKLSVLGQWDLSYKIAERDVAAKLTVSQKPDGTLDAKWTSQFGESVVADVKLQDGKLTFSRTTKFNDQQMKSTFEGTAQGNKLTGTIKSDRGEIPVTGQRAGTALIGKWELTSTSERGTRTSVMTIDTDMTGRYEMFGGEIPIKDLTLEGDQVSFKLEMGFGDQTFVMDFKGKLDGKTLKGQTTSERGTSEVTGKKIEPASTFVGTWELTSESAQGTRTNTLKINADMTGTYTARDTETPITDLRIEGDQITFKVIRKFNEQEVTTEFKGKLEGQTLKGQMISQRGTREVTGKKVN